MLKPCRVAVLPPDYYSRKILLIMDFSLKQKKGNPHAALERVIYTFPNGKDTLTERESHGSALVLGEIGSGKTSGFSSQLFDSYLKCGYGGIVLSVKKESGKQMLEKIRRSGRKVIHFHNGSKLAFNPFEYELLRQGDGSKEINNLTNLIVMLSILLSNFKSGGTGGKNEDRFWQLAMERMVNRAISLLQLADLSVTLDNINSIVSNCFTEDDAHKYSDIWSVLLDENTTEERKKEVFTRYRKWVNSNFFLYVFDKANSRKNLSEEENYQMRQVGDYFTDQFPKLASKTKTIVLETFYGITEAWNSPMLRRHFGAGVSEELLPENTYQNGDIVLVDFSIKEFGISGIFANAIYKYIWQTAMERRTVSEESNPKSVFLWVDEAHSLINPNYDNLFQSTARESMVATVYITQTINSLIGAFGSDNADNKAKSLIANLGLKVFCANSDYDTNEFAANMIGKHFTDTNSVSFDHEKNARHSYSQEYHFKVAPDHYSLLKTGSPSNNFKVESILFKAGKQWADGRNFLAAGFDQRH